MKRVLSIALLILSLTLLPAGAKNKVVEKSAKKVPEWVYGANDGYLVVTVEAANPGEAQDRAMEVLAERVVSSIATNVSSTTTSSMTLKTHGSATEESELFNTTSRLRSANLPFLQGLSQMNVKDVYWQRLRDDSGREWVEYSILYPFSQRDLKTLQDQFNALEKQNNEALRELESGLASLDSVEAIKEGISRIEQLEQYFIDDVRLKQAATLKTRYRDQYKNLALTYRELGNGAFHIGATLSGRPVKLTVKPKAVSECASQIRLQAAGDGYDLTCNTEDCLPEELNSVTVSVRIEGHKCSLEIPLKL